MTDGLLVSLQSFSSNHLYYTIPESARRGVPLFYLPPNSPQPVSDGVNHVPKLRTRSSSFSGRKR